MAMLSLVIPSEDVGDFLVRTFSQHSPHINKTLAVIAITKRAKLKLSPLALHDIYICVAENPSIVGDVINRHIAENV